MMDLERAAEAATVGIKELSSRVDRAEAAFAALEQKLEQARTRGDADWAALEEKAGALLARVRAESDRIEERGDEAHEGIGQLDATLERTAGEWDDAIEEAASAALALGTRVSERAAPLSTQAADAASAVRRLAERAASIEAELHQAVTAARELLETQVRGELEEARESIRERARSLQAVLADECERTLAEAFAGWEQQLLQVEQVLEEEFGAARQHAADVVEFSLEECRRGHDETWTDLASSVAALDGLLVGLGDVVTARTTELGARRGAGQEAFADAAAAVERVRASLARDLETLESYSFVGGGGR